MRDKWKPDFALWGLLIIILAVGSCGNLNCGMFPLNNFCTWGGKE